MTHLCPKCHQEPEIIGRDYYHCIDCSQGDIEDLIEEGMELEE